MYTKQRKKLGLRASTGVAFWGTTLDSPTTLSLIGAAVRSIFLRFEFDSIFEKDVPALTERTKGPSVGTRMLLVEFVTKQTVGGHSIDVQINKVMGFQELTGIVLQ